MQRFRRSAALTLTICLICSQVSWASGAKSTPGIDLDARRVHAGWTAPRAGYFLTDRAMRDTIAGWTAATNQLAIREQVIDALRLAIADQTAHIRTELDAIKDEAAAERSRLKRQARRGKLQGLALGLILGVAFAAAR